MSATGDIQKTSKLLKETGQSMPDWKIFCDIAKAMDKDLRINDLMSIRAAIADKVVKEEIKEITPTFNPTKLDLLESTNDEFPMFLITANILQHSGALSALSKNLDSVVSDAYLQVNTKDAKRLNIYNESFVRVRSKRGEVYLKAMLSDEVPEGIVFAPIHFSHAKINTLTYPSINGGLPLVAVKIEGV
jgi:predicted molibdopterin-dependent oxidoreductase YjgC